MGKFRQIGLAALVSASVCFAATASAQTSATQPASPFASRVPVVRTSATAPQAATLPGAVKRVQVLGGKSAIEIEVEGSDRLTPQTRVLTNPDRLVIDFPNASPSSQVRNQSVNRGEVKDVRVGLFQTTPPVTRLVVDLKSPQSFQIFPSGKTIIIKVNGKDKDQSLEKKSAAQGVDDFPEPATRPGLLTTNYAAGAGNIRAAAAEPVLDVTFRNGLLTIKSSKASLSEILNAVHQRTGADVTLSAGAEQEKVAADIGPAPAPEVLTRLLNGSKFNYLILSAANDPHVLDKVILSPKAEGAITPLPPMANNNDDMTDDGPPPLPIPQRRTEQQGQGQGQGEDPSAVTNAPPTNMPPGYTPQMNPALPHGQTMPPPQPPSTPPPDDNSN
ncbi:MAG: AMIN domain-containing protein [Candidatus Sulfotelmatobacter sp.]